MFENFKDYLWYLIPSPYKIIKKSKNQWYIFFTVIGRWFDEIREDLQSARDQTTIATCDDIMLFYHAEDKGLYQYDGEANDDFRRRIAMYDQTLESGGTVNGITLALKTLGYVDVNIIWMVKELEDDSRWAEFIVDIQMDVYNVPTVSIQVLKDTVRKWKQSDSLDNYRMKYIGNFQRNTSEITLFVKEIKSIYHNGYIYDGNICYDGSVGYGEDEKTFEYYITTIQES